MLAERCPNCGAFLPVRQPGVAIRTCEFCGLEVPGDSPVVEVERLTTERPAVQPPDEPRPTWTPPARDVGAGVRRAIVVFVAFLVLGAGFLVGGLMFVLRSGSSTVRRTVRPSPPVEAPLPGPPLAAPDPGELAVTAAVAGAGGVAALDPLALQPLVDERARAFAADARLLSVQCFPVRAPGRADLTLARGRCGWEYRSPAGTVRPPDVPVGIEVEYPCLVGFDLARDTARLDPRAMRYPLRLCRMHHAVRPPRCTLEQVWSRAAARGVPAEAVARVRYAGRYHSGYDPVDLADDFDEPERGRWTVEVEREGAGDLRVEVIDDCGQGPPTADEKAVLAALKKATPALDRCFTTAAAGHDAVEAFELVWRLAVDARGAATLTFADPGVDLEGTFSGDLGAVRARWATCSAKVGRGLRLPPGLPALRLELRLERGGTLVVAPPPFD